MIELKNCPFCNGEACLVMRHIKPRESDDQYLLLIVCDDCNSQSAKASLTPCYDIQDDISALVESWNKRAKN